MLTVGSLFSGIGGLDLGLERAGMHVLWQCEADPYCRAVLRKHWPDIPCYPDVRAVGAELERVDVLAGGFPCQPVSRPGRRLVGEDDRWLWPEFDRLIRLLRPHYVFVENVPGLLDSGLGAVLGDLAGAGYDAEWDCVGACALGAPMHRERVWLLAYPHDQGLQGTVWAGQPIAPRNTGAPTHREPLRPDTRPWPPGPGALDDIPRMADGPTNRAHRLRALGNAVVPQVAEYIGRLIVAHAEGEAA